MKPRSTEILLNRPELFSDESMRGYIIRLAHANGINAQKVYKKINMVNGTAIKNIIMGRYQ